MMRRDVRKNVTQYLIGQLTLAALIAIFALPAFAQNNLNGIKQELDKEIDELYPEESEMTVTVRPARTLPPANQTVRVESQEIVAQQPAQQVQVVRTAPVQQVQPIQQQPTLRVRQEPLTLVEANPVDESQADKLRRNRMDYEQETEQKLVEKLESERIESEKSRRQAILDKLNNEKEEKAPEPVPAPVAPPVYYAPQAPLAVEPVETIEPAPAIDTVMTDMSNDMEKPKNRFYIGGQAGVGVFPSVDNIESGFSGGFAAGMMFDKGWVAELGFNYSEYQMERIDSLYSNPFNVGEMTDIEEYAVSLGVKYQFLQSTVRPVAGILGLFRNRTYIQSQYVQNPNPEIQSNAFDFGFSGGVDFVLDEAFSIGTEMKYLINMTNQVDGVYDPYYADSRGAEEADDLSYFIFGLNAKLIF